MATNTNENDSFSKVMNILARVAVGLFAVALVFTLCYSLLNSTGILAKNVTAMEVGDHKLSVKEFNLYYNAERVQLMNNAMVLQYYYGVDLSRPLEGQKYSDSMTWGDYMREQAAANAKTTYLVYDEAMKAGYEMSDKDKQNYEKAMANLTEAAETYEMTEKEYIKGMYGKHASRADVEEMTRVATIAQGYANSLQDGYRAETTSDAVNKYYEEHKDKFDEIDYREFLFSYGSSDEESKKAAKEKADAFIAKVHSEQDFIDASVEFAEEAAKESYKDSEKTKGTLLWSENPAGDRNTWLCSADRKTGDTTVEDTGTAYTALYYIDKSRDERNTVDVRHILVKADKPQKPAEPAADATEEVKKNYEDSLKKYEEDVKAYDEAKAKMDEIKAEWDASDKTPATFGALADKYSDDSPEGGLYEEVKHDQMVAAFDSWIFDESRKAGDCEIVETEYGFHLIYFLGEGRATWYVNAENEIVSEQYTAWYDAAAKDYPSELHETALALIKA